jgi:hypothetical protein
MIDVSGLSKFQEITIGLSLCALLYVGLRYSAREKDALRLAQVWREYAARHGYEVFAPGRFIWLSPSEGEIYAKIEGVRNSVSFTAEITAYDPDEGGTKETSFRCTPTWLPNESGISITPRQPRSSWMFSTPQPALVRHRLNVYTHPAELASVFNSPHADKLLADFAKLPSGTDAVGWRKDSQAKLYDGGAIMFMSVDEWCDDAAQLDACIDVLTRLCSFAPNNPRP